MPALCVPGVRWELAFTLLDKLARVVVHHVGGAGN